MPTTCLAQAPAAAEEEGGGAPQSVTLARNQICMRFSDALIV